MSLDLEAGLAGARVVPILTVPSTEMAEPLAEALAEAGIQCVEVTLRTEAAEQVLEVMAAHKALTVGAGTVLTAGQAERAVAAGAAFIVSPGFDAELLGHCAELGVPACPGIATATELMSAMRFGVNVVKLFPAEQLGGLPMLRALAEPFPRARFVPTGGIGAYSAARYLAHPAVVAVGGSWIAPADLLEAGDYTEIWRRAALAVQRSAS